MVKKIIIVIILVLAAGAGWLFFTKSGQKAQIIYRTGGKGPGGCVSAESCKAYCDNTQHSGECFAFYREQGFVTAEQVKTVADVQERLRASLKTMSRTTRACVEKRAGKEVVAQLEAGTLPLWPSLGADFQACSKK